MANLIKSGMPCPKCRSKNNLALYDDGKSWCFTPGCGAGEKWDTSTYKPRKKSGEELTQFVVGDYQDIPARGLTEETCKKFGYSVGEYNGDRCHIANFYDKTGRLVAQKLRFKDKSFKVIGDTKEALLFGSNAWQSGRKIVITEGEIDAMSVSQIQNNKWPTVSIINGAQSAKKSLLASKDYLERFEEIILMFDNDEHGDRAAQECTKLFAPGRVKLAKLPLKDANDMLLAKRGSEVVSAIFNAQVHRPQGIKNGADLKNILYSADVQYHAVYPFEPMNKMVGGLLRPSLITVSAGSGIGKSSLIKELAYSLGVVQGQKVGMMLLEETNKKTVKSILGLHMNKNLSNPENTVTSDELAFAFDDTFAKGNFILYDNFGATGIDTLLENIRFMATAEECKWVILDHISIIISGSDEDNERKLIDNVVTKLRTLVQELDIGLIMVSHLKRPEGKGHEEGARVALSQLRGSHSIAQLSDVVWGMERNQQGNSSNITTIRCLKNREQGETGVACDLIYDKVTGRLSVYNEADEIQKQFQVKGDSAEENTKDDF